MASPSESHRGESGVHRRLLRSITDELAEGRRCPSPLPVCRLSYRTGRPASRIDGGDAQEYNNSEQVEWTRGPTIPEVPCNVDPT